jgi:hypothetical protein
MTPGEPFNELAAAQAGRYFRHVEMIFPPGGQLSMTVDRPGDGYAFLFTWRNSTTDEGPYTWDVMPGDLELTRSVFTMAQLPLRRFFPPPPEDEKTAEPFDDDPTSRDNRRPDES